MRTTLDLDDRLVIRAKTVAASRGTSLTRLIEEGLRQRLKQDDKPANARFRPLPVFRGGGGLRPGIDPCSNRSLFEAAGDDGP